VGKWECVACSCVCDLEAGDPDGGVPPRTPFEDLPDARVRSDFGVVQDMFDRLG
jgi:rubredoxin